jgi:hypothetical protein
MLGSFRSNFTHFIMEQQTPTSPLSVRQLSDKELQKLRDSLKDPMSGRSVHIPLGKRAYFRGQLSPDRCADDDATNTSHSLDSQQVCSERVSLRMDDGTLNNMSRLEALDFIEKELHRRISPSTTTSTNHSMPQQTKSAEKVSSPPTTQTRPAPAAEESSSETPYFEIREELDDAGALVRSEAINVTRHLEYWQQQAHGSSDKTATMDTSHNVAAKDASIPAVPLDESPPSLENVIELPLNDGASPQPLSDSDYEALMARLDHLALLEEQADLQKEVNIKSSVALQSKGWTKGFFNKKPAAKKGATVINDNSMVKEAAVKERSALERDAASVETARDQRPKSVAFTETNQVQEIPRVGERSVHSIAKKQQPITSPKPLDPSLFPGLVVEQAKRRPIDTNIAATGPSVDSVDRPKSRFAQQRQEIEHRASAESAISLKQSTFAQQRARR